MKVVFSGEMLPLHSKGWGVCFKAGTQWQGFEIPDCELCSLHLHSICLSPSWIFPLKMPLAQHITQQKQKMSGGKHGFFLSCPCCSRGGSLWVSGWQFCNVSIASVLSFSLSEQGRAMKSVHCSESSCDWVIMLTTDKCTRLGYPAVLWQVVLNWWAGWQEHCVSLEILQLWVRSLLLQRSTALSAGWRLPGIMATQASTQSRMLFGTAQQNWGVWSRAEIWPWLSQLSRSWVPLHEALFCMFSSSNRITVVDHSGLMLWLCQMPDPKSSLIVIREPKAWDWLPAFPLDERVATGLVHACGSCGRQLPLTPKTWTALLSSANPPVQYWWDGTCGTTGGHIPAPQYP